MDFARTMVKLFPETTFPENLFFKYGNSYYRIKYVKLDRIGYITPSGSKDSLLALKDATYDYYTIKSVKFEGSRLRNNLILVINIGG